MDMNNVNIEEIVKQVLEACWKRKFQKQLRHRQQRQETKFRKQHM